MKMNLEIKKKSGYWCRIWKQRGEMYQRIAEKFSERGDEQKAQFHRINAKESLRRSNAYNPKSV